MFADDNIHFLLKKTTNHLIRRSLDHSISRSLDQSLARSPNRSIIRSIARSIARPSDRSIARSIARLVAKTDHRPVRASTRSNTERLPRKVPKTQKSNPNPIESEAGQLQKGTFWCRINRTREASQTKPNFLATYSRQSKGYPKGLPKILRGRLQSLHHASKTPPRCVLDEATLKT